MESDFKILDVGTVEDPYKEKTSSIPESQKTGTKSQHSPAKSAEMISQTVPTPDSNTNIKICDSDKSMHKCEGCKDCVELSNGKRQCTSQFQIRLSDLSGTVLEFLEEKNWRNCPYCLAAVKNESLPTHLISHADVYNVVGDVEYNNNTIISKPYMKQSYDSPKLKGSVTELFMCALI